MGPVSLLRLPVHHLPLMLAQHLHGVADFEPLKGERLGLSRPLDRFRPESIPVNEISRSAFANRHVR